MLKAVPQIPILFKVKHTHTSKFPFQEGSDDPRFLNNPSKFCSSQATATKHRLPCFQNEDEQIDATKRYFK